MVTEIITEETIGKYLKVLKNEEIFGILDGRISAIAVWDEEKEQPQGVLTAEIHTELILIRRIYVLPEYRDGETGNVLMHIATDIPEEQRVPYVIYGTDDEIDETLLAEYGFSEVPSKYSWIEGVLENYKEIKVPPKAFDMGTLDKAPMDKVQDFVLKSDPDRFMQMPDGYLESGRFSDASLICMKNDAIVGVILLEELDDSIQIPYIHTKDNLALLYSLYVLRKVLWTEYEPTARLQFLMNDGIGREALTVLIHPSEEKKIRIFRYE